MDGNVNVTVVEEQTGIHIVVRGSENLRDAILRYQPYSIRLSDFSESLKLPPGQSSVGVLILDCPNLIDLWCECTWEHLTMLWISDCPLASASFVGEMPMLADLSVNRSTFTNVDPLRGHRMLKELYLPNSSVEDFSGIADIPNLTDLNLHNASISTLDGILDHIALGRLSIARTPLTTLGGLVNRHSLWSLSVADCFLESMKELERTPELQYLSMRGTRCRDYQFLGSLKALERVQLAGSDIADLGVIETCELLNDIDLRGTAIRTLRPLLALDNLESVWISPDMEDLEGAIEIRNRGVSVIVEKFPNRTDRKQQRQGSWTY